MDLNHNGLDSDLQMSKDEIKGFLKDTKTDDTTKHDFSVYEPSIPQFTEVLPYMPALKQKDEKRISLSIDKTIDVKEVLSEVSELSSIEMTMDPNISGGVIINVVDRPVMEVIDMICEMSGLRYDIQGGILRIVKDTPYLSNYSVDYLNIIRSSHGSINTQTQVLSSATSGGGLNSGSTNTINTEYDGDLWTSIENNLTSILGARFYSHKYNDAPDEDADNGKQKHRTRQMILPENTYYTINKQAGIISIMADSKKHKAVSMYLNKVKEHLSAQVLIEAKVVEVVLNDAFSSGINWSKLRSGNSFDGSFSYNNRSSVLSDGFGSPLLSGIIKSNSFTVGKNIADSTGSGITAVVNALKAFGLTRTLSNPRITALNNQQAVLTFAKNHVYYTVQGTPQISDGNNTIITPASVASTLHTIPLGLILSLQPSINLDTREVTMNIRPTLSKKAGDGIEDPAAHILNRSLGDNSSTTFSSTVPVVEVREMDTVLKVKSGDIIVIGGLIQHKDIVKDVGVPVLNSIPLIKDLTSYKEKTAEIIETVILLQAHIITPDGYYHEQDKALYDQFIHDKRKLDFRE